jgi:hypothetical protein
LPQSTAVADSCSSQQQLQILATVNSSCRVLQQSTAVLDPCKSQLTAVTNSCKIQKQLQSLATAKGMHQLFCFWEKTNDIALIGKYLYSIVLFYANNIKMT